MYKLRQNAAQNPKDVYFKREISPKGLNGRTQIGGISRPAQDIFREADKEPTKTKEELFWVYSHSNCREVILVA